MDENQIADILQEQTQNTFGSEDSIPQLTPLNQSF